MSNEFDRLKEAFFMEAKSHIETISAALLKFEKKSKELKFLHDIFRSTHTLKSMSAAMEFHNMAKLCHAVEDLLDAYKKKIIELEVFVNELLSALDFLKENLNNVEKYNQELDTSYHIQKISSIINKTPIDHLPESVVNNDNTETSIEKVKSIEVKAERLDVLLNLAEELLANKMKLDLIRGALEDPELSTAVEILGRTISELQYNIMKIRMISLSFIFNQYPRLVRDISKQQHKEVNLTIEGSEIELDRTIIDEVSESLVHLLRNAIDHGLETPEERIKAHKKPSGQITLSARTKESVIIELSDDGRGINLEEIRSIGIKRGMLTPGDSRDRVLETIFQGISTSKKVTDISGRGLGLDIVKQKIESIDGSIQVKSILHQGTQFIIEIPFSLAVLRSLFVKVKNRIYAIPVANIEKLVVATNSELKSMLNQEALILGEEEIPVIRLNRLFKAESFQREDRRSSKQPIVVVQKGSERFGLAVDELLTTQEIVIKPLSRFVKDSKFFSGSAIIGSGEVILILDIAHLSALRIHEPRIFSEE